MKKVLVVVLALAAVVAAALVVVRELAQVLESVEVEAEE